MGALARELLTIKSVRVAIRIQPASYVGSKRVLFVNIINSSWGITCYDVPFRELYSTLVWLSQTSGALLRKQYSQSCIVARDEPILLFLIYFSFWQFFFLTYYAQYFAVSFNILLKVQLNIQLLNSDIIHIYTLTTYTHHGQLQLD